MSKRVGYRNFLLLSLFILVAGYGLKAIPSPLSMFATFGKGQDKPTRRPDKVDGQNQRVPRYQVYQHLFAILESLDKEADKRKANGEDDSFHRYFYKRAAGLSDDQWAKLTTVVSDTRTELAEIEDNARAIIDDHQKRVSKLKRGEPFPLSRDKELMDLQHKHNRIFADVPRRIKEELGAEEFDRFDKFARTGLQVDQQGVKLPWKASEK